MKDALQRAERMGSDAHAFGTPRQENPYQEFAGIAPAGELAAAWWRGWDTAEILERLPGDASR